MTVKRSTGLRWWVAAAWLFFVAATLWAVVAPVIASDLWIALASGRWMLEHGQVTRVDPFSYTFPGRPWFNQNWLSHVALYLLYSRVGPLATLCFAWLCGAAIFAVIAWNAWQRTRLTSVALLTAGLAAVACHRYLDPRPATIGLLLAAVTWSLLRSLGPGGPGRAGARGVRAAILAVVLIFWGCAHGSFVFGYQLVLLYLVCGLASRVLLANRPRPAGGQLGAVAAASIAAMLFTIAFGPYGLQNFTHPLTVAGSPVWRTINEWRPPWVRGAYPPTTGFWIVVAVGAAALLIAPIGRRMDRRASLPLSASLTLFDIAAAVICLGMALWARRFIPLFCIVAADVFAAGVVARARERADATARLIGRLTAAAAAFGGAALLVLVALQLRDAREAMGRSPGTGLFDWAVNYASAPADGIEFIQRNDLRLNVLADWANAAPLLFLSPQCRVFADGRAQQVYPVEHFERFQTLMGGNFDAAETQRILDESHTDAILFARVLTPSAGLPRHILSRPDDWLLVFASPNSMLLIRRPSAALVELGRLEREGCAWWPNTPKARATRANILLKTDPPDEDRAIDLLRAAVAEDPSLGESAYLVLTRLWLRCGQRDEAIRFLESESARIADPRASLDERSRDRLRNVLDRCWQQVR